MPPATSRKQASPIPRSRPARSEAARRCGEALPVGQDQRLVHDRLEFAAVVDGAVGRAERHGGGGDQVAASELHAVDAGGGGGLIDQALDEVERLRAAGPAIGPERGRVREGQRHVDGDGRDAVDARQAILGVVGPEHRRERGDVGADADAGADAEGEEAAGRVEGQLPLEHAVAAVRVGQEALDAGRAPLDGPAHSARREEQRRVLRIGLHLHAEAAAHVGGDHAELRGRDLEDAFGEEAPHHRDALGGRGERVALRGLVPLADGRARLERGGRQPRVVEAHPRHVRGGAHRRVHRDGVAVGPVERDVVRRVGPDRVRAAGQRAVHVRGRGERVEIHAHRRGGVHGLRRRLGHHDGDRFAHVAHAVHRERRDGRDRQELAAAPGEGGGGRDRAQSRRDRVAPGEDREHAGHGERPARVHGADDPVRGGGAGERGVGLAGQVHVVGEAAAAGEERTVLAAPAAGGGAEAQRGPGTRQFRNDESVRSSRRRRPGHTSLPWPPLRRWLATALA